jgi:hypothetical protein
MDFLYVLLSVLSVLSLDFSAVAHAGAQMSSLSQVSYIDMARQLAKAKEHHLHVVSLLFKLKLFIKRVD